MELGVLFPLPRKRSDDLVRLMKAAKQRSVKLQIYHPQDLIIRIEKDRLLLLDREQKNLGAKGFINWSPYDSTEEFSRACQALQIPIINTATAVRTAKNKMVTGVMLAAAGISQPDTLYVAKTGKHQLLPLLDVPCVSKPKNGSRGLHSYKFTSASQLQHFLKRRKTSELYLQTYVQKGGWDLRVVVVGGRVVGALRKTAAPGEWRTHLAHGGEAELFSVDEELAQVAVKTAEALGLVIAGIDIVLDQHRGYLVLEANSVPGLGVFEETTGMSLSGEIIDQLISMI